MGPRSGSDAVVPVLTELTAGDVCAWPVSTAARALGEAVERHRAGDVARWGDTPTPGVLRLPHPVDVEVVHSVAAAVAVVQPATLRAVPIEGTGDGAGLRAVAGAHHWCPQLGRLVDEWTVAWSATIEASVVEVSEPVRLAPANRIRVVLPLSSSGSASRAGSDATGDHAADGGGSHVLVCPSGAPVDLVGRSGDMVALFEIAQVGPTDVVETLVRNCGFDPLLRADLPLDDVVPIPSYGGSVFDTADGLNGRVQTVLTVGVVERAIAWFHAHLRGATAVECGPSLPTARLRPVAPLVVIDPQQTQAGGVPDDHVVAAVGGRVLPLTPERQTALIGALDGTRELNDDDLAAVLAVAGWWVDASARDAGS